MKRIAICMLVLASVIVGCDNGPAASIVGESAGLSAIGGPVIEPAVVQSVQRDGATDMLVYFGERPDLSAAKSMDWQARGRFVVDSLRAAAQAAQKPAVEQLRANGVAYESFWIDNVIAIHKADRNTLQAVAAIPGVQKILAPRRLGIIEPERRLQTASIGINAVEANIDHVDAPLAWANGVNGAGIVVANIDTGVRYTHSVLQPSYRGNNGDGTFSHEYNWFDPYVNTPAPIDENGHGSHTMGTIVGDDGIGVNATGMAPGARWIACRGCDTSSCTDTALLTCAQWVMAPTDLVGANPDPDRRAHVVNNSWGDCGTSYDSWYQGVVDSWHAAGVYPVFSNGNSSNCGYSEPPACNTVGNPGRYGNVTGVGSTTQSSGQYATHSLQGPTDNVDTINGGDYPTLKPQVVAPGQSIRSAVATGDTAFESWDGTSMSAPHVTGLVSLMWQAGPCLVGDYATTETLMETAATPIPYASGCGGEGVGNVPNMATGWGEINAAAAVELAAEICGPSGTVTGIVTDTAGLPIEGAMVQIGGRGDETGADGGYRITFVPVGTVDVTASHFWHHDATVSGVIVNENQETMVNLQMTTKETVTVTGTVFDGADHGWPLYARITVSPIAGSDSMTVFSNPFDGTWSVDVIPGEVFEYDVDPWLDGYQAVSVPYVALGSDDVLDFALPIVDDCSAPGYRMNVFTLLSQDFEADNGGFMVSGTQASWQWGTPTAGATVAHSGTNVWATNLAGNYNNSEASYLQVPDINAAGVPGTLNVGWWHWLSTESGYDFVSLQASNDGGFTWNTFWGRYSGNLAAEWTEAGTELPDEYKVSNLKLRFVFTSDSSVARYGWYIDDVVVSTSGCVAVPGGLNGGYAYDSATGEHLNDVSVEGPYGRAVTRATPEDPAVGDGLWFLAGDAGQVTFTGRKYGYAATSVMGTLQADNTVRTDLPMSTSPISVLNGIVTDGSGHGWPLYARVDVVATDWNESLYTYTDPFTGEWSIDVFGDYNYSISFNSELPGYDPMGVAVTVDAPSVVVNAALVTTSCAALGYNFDDCTPIPGGLFGGFVTDAATGDAMNGVVVEVPTVSAWVSMPTTLDDAIPDGLYFVFAAADQEVEGNITVTANYPMMTPFMAAWPSAPGQVVRHDVGITEAVLSVAPSDQVIQVVHGSSATGQAVIENDGLGYGDFSINEKPVYGQGPNETAYVPKILTYYANLDGSAAGSPLSVAIESLGYSSLNFYGGQDVAFVDALTAQDWDLVIYDGELDTNPIVFEPLHDYVLAGGKLVLYSYLFYDPTYRAIPLLREMKVVVTRYDAVPEPVYKWIDHPLFSLVDQVPNLEQQIDARVGISGMSGNAMLGGLAIAGEYDYPKSGKAALIVANDDRTLWRGFTDYANNVDQDQDGRPDTVQIWRNTVTYMLAAGVVDVPWLSETPISGRIESGSSAPVVLKADSAGMEPGRYSAQVRVVTPHSRKFVQPAVVTMDIGHVVTVVQAANGMISPEGESFVSHGGTLEIGFAPADGYHVKDVIVDGVSFGRMDTLQLGPMVQSHIVTAVFEPSCHDHADCVNPENDCLGFCNVDECEPLKVRPVNWPCGDQGDYDCGNPDSCDGAGRCLPNFEPSVVVCRMPEGDCDAMDFCDGRSERCPADGKLTTECRGAFGVCDAPEMCNGMDNDCPADVKLTTECRGSFGVCDVAESCNGVDNDCPADGKLTTECRGAFGVCDAPEMCNGMDNDCPDDVKLTTECRGSFGVCDVAESCNGVDNDCPADVKLTTECRGSFGVCDVAESCNGVDNDCPADVKLTTECRGAGGVCDTPESCNGVDNDCPADVFAGSDVSCDDGNSCTSNDRCDGSRATCVADAYECQAGPCDESVVCDGAGGCTPTWKAIGVECDDGIACTVGETCQAGGQCVAETVLVCDEPPHPECVNDGTSRVWAPDGVCSSELRGCAYESRLYVCANACDAATGLCDDVEIACPDVTSVDQPCTVGNGYPVLGAADGQLTCYYKPLAAGTACDDGDHCTLDETCDGNGNCLGAQNPACIPEPVPEVGDDIITSDVISDAAQEDAWDAREDDAWFSDSGCCDHASVDVVVEVSSDVGPVDIIPDMGGDDLGRPDVEQEVAPVDTVVQDQMASDANVDEDTGTSGGGDGCSSTGNGGGLGWVMLAISLAFLAMTRRRRV